MGATASTVKSYNEIVSSHKRGQTFIPIHGIHEHLRMFQHQKDGDILILIDTDAEAFLKDPTSSEYHEIFISRRGTEYLDNVAGAMTFQASKALSNISSTYERNGNSPSHLPNGHTGATNEDGTAPEKEPTLYQLHLREHTNRFFDAVETPDTPAKEEAQQSPLPDGERATDAAEEKTDKEDKEEKDPEASRSLSLRELVSGVSASLDHESESMRHNNSGLIGTPLVNRSIDIESDFVVNSAFSSLSRSVDTRENPPPTSAAAAIFLRHEQEALARARGESLRSIAEESDAKSVSRFSPRRNSTDSKEFPVRESSTPRLSPRATAAPGSAHSIATGSPAMNSTSATAGASPALSSRAESKESKDSGATHSAPAAAPVRKREIVPVAYLPPSEYHRKRILEEDLAHDDAGRGSGAKPPTSARDRDAKVEQGSALIFTPRGSALSAAADSKSPPMRSPRGVLRADALISPRSTALAAPITAGIGAVSPAEPRRRTGSECCPVCFLPLRSTGDSARHEVHIASCRKREEMKHALVNIDQNLEPKLEELSEFNRKQMESVYSNAIERATEEIDQCAAAHAVVRKIVKSVLLVTYDTSPQKVERLQSNLVSVQDQIVAHIAEAEMAVRKGNAEAQRRIAAYAHLSRILQQTADKLTQKCQHIAAYKQYLIGIGDFTVLRKLGQGSFASVYLARFLDTRQVYALKALRKDEVLRRGLHDQVTKERTALTMASRYPNYFVKLLYCFQNDEHLFFVMEYMEGGDCLSLISSMKRLPEHVAQHFVAQVCVALQHLHQHGVIHRDIKPDNVMISSRGHAKLGDFGSVHPIHADFRYAQARKAALPAAASKAGPNAAEILGLQSLNSRGESQQHSLVPKLGVNPVITSVTQLANEISAVAAEACRNLASGKYSSSRSNSFWLEEEILSQQVPSGKASASASGNWSNSTTSSLYFGKNTAGPVMQNTFDIVGNYFYASPEMAAGACVFNQSVDWWAVGVLLFHMLSGTTPFEGLTKAATLENIERMAVDWDPLPSVSPECKDFLKRILEHGYETRLGSQRPEQVLGHEFFANIDFATLYDGLGPLYPRAPRADESSRDFYCFTAMTEEESLAVPDFAPKRKAEAKEHDETARRSPRATSPRESTAASGEDGADEDVFQDFDYHPF